MISALVLLGGPAVLVVTLAWAPGRAVPAARRPTGWWAARRPQLRAHRRRPLDLGVVVAEVASRLRAGTPPDQAWGATVERLLGPPPTGAPDVAPAPGDVPPALARLAAHCAGQVDAAAAARTVVAASRLTQVLGAPLAEVLDRCAVTVTEAEHARDARRVALAGPRSTARILAGLPLLGLLLGAGLGADPLATATDGGWGTVSVVLGIGLLLAGRHWTRALVAAAQGPTAGRKRSPRRPGER